MNRIYFETSGVNYLFDNIFNNDDEYSSIKTKQLQIQKGKKWQISNITLWEIFLTKDETRRYNLFDFSRCLYYDHLICGPEEIIINFIKSGCPIVEKPYELNSISLFSDEWTKACQNLDYAFQPDREQIESFSHHLRALPAIFVNNGKGITFKTHEEITSNSRDSAKSLLRDVYNTLVKLYFEEITEEDKTFLICSIQNVLLIICYGIGFDQKLIENFWSEKGKNNPFERLEIALKEFPDIFIRGPLANMTEMMILQSKGKMGRGIYFDSLHSIYITYSDIYITNDQHFLHYKEAHKNDPMTRKVISVKDMHFFRAK